MRITNLRARFKNLVKRIGKNPKQQLAAAVVTGGLLFSGSAANGADIVLNGGFESPDTGWTNQGGDYTHPYGGINGPQLTDVGTLNDYGFEDNISADAGTSFHGLAFPTTQTVDLVNADLTASDILAGDGRFAFSSWLTTCCNDVPKITATFDTGGSTTFNRGISDHMLTTADIIVNPGGFDNEASQGVIDDVNRRYWALYEFKGVIPVNATQVTITVDDGRADAAAAGANTGGNGNDNYVDMVIFDAVKSTDIIFDLVMKMSINRDDGMISLINNTGAAQQTKGYSLMSATGSLIESDAVFLADSDPDWVQFTASGATDELSEGNLTTDTFNTGTVHTLGPAWLQYYDESDITFEYLDGNGDVVSGLVEFSGTTQTSPFGQGDLNFDGNIDGSDWVEYFTGLGTTQQGQSIAQAYRDGDLNGDLVNNHADFLIFQGLYDAANGTGALASLIAGVPEPSSLVLFALAGMGIVGSGGNRHRRNSTCP